MAKVFAFAVIGLGVGGLYALFALGLTMIFKVSRVPNFAHGAIALFVGFFHFTLTGDLTTAWRVPFRDPTNPLRLSGHVPFWISFAISIVVAVLLGLAIERFAIRPFEGASMLTMVIVTLGLTLLLQAFTADVWGLQVNYGLKSGFPEGGIALPAHTQITYSQIAFLLIAVALALGLAAVFKYTNIGIAIRVTAENKDIARILGIPPERVTAVGWAIGSALAGMAGIWVMTIVGTDVLLIPFFLVIKGLAASLAGGMVGLVGTVIGGILIGMLEILTKQFVHIVGLDQAVSFVLILLLLLSRPPWIFRVVRKEEESGLATRATVLKNLPIEAAARRLALVLPVGGPLMSAPLFAAITAALAVLALVTWGTGAV